MTSSDRVAEDGHLRPPAPPITPITLPPDIQPFTQYPDHSGFSVPGARVIPTELQAEFKSPPFVHALLDVVIDRRRALDFKGNPVPEDVKRRLEEAFGPFSPASPEAQQSAQTSEPETDDLQILPPPTYKLRGAITHIMLGHQDRAIKIVKDFTPQEAKQFLDALETLSAMLVARYSIEFIDEMLTVEP